MGCSARGQVLIIKQSRVQYRPQLIVIWGIPVYTSPNAEIVQIACQITDTHDPQTVPYGTDAFYLNDLCDLVVLRPADIAQAHTVGEWIDIDQLNRAIAVYGQMIQTVCM